jgi:hypothetical protein
MSAYFRFSILLPAILALFGTSFVVWAGSCYVQTSTIPSNALGCSETFIGPQGLACPSMTRLNPENVASASCRFRIDTNNIGVGTSGNEDSGRMNQDSVARPCFTYVSCVFDGPCFDIALPLTLYYLCYEDETYPGSAERYSVEPTGGNCPDE